MTDDQIQNEIVNARRKDGTFPYEFVKVMNEQGIYFAFELEGVRWSRNKKNDAMNIRKLSDAPRKRASFFMR